jgi:hypothetical protein
MCIMKLRKEDRVPYSAPPVRACSAFKSDEYTRSVEYSGSLTRVIVYVLIWDCIISLMNRIGKYTRSQVYML